MFQQQEHPYTAAVQAFRPLAELVPTHWESGFVKADDGARLHYVRTGKMSDHKPGVVLLHGVQVNGLTWLRTAQALEADYDVLMPDFRGHGESARVGATALSADLLVRDTVAIMKMLGKEKPFVVGHSMGADIAGRGHRGAAGGGSSVAGRGSGRSGAAEFRGGYHAHRWHDSTLDAGTFRDDALAQDAAPHAKDGCWFADAFAGYTVVGRGGLCQFRRWTGAV